MNAQSPVKGGCTSLQPRTQADSFGPIEVPGDALWGAQTARSLRFFSIGEQRMPLGIVHALAQVKRAAAEVNGDLGLLEPERATAVAAAATRIAAGELDEQFPLSVWQTGSGTQSNMNVNEVIARLASNALSGGPGAERRVHPNDDVNLGQSSNDVFPTAMHIAAALRMGGHASHVEAGMGRVFRLLAQVPSIDANVLRRLGLQEDGTHAGQAVQEVLPFIDSRTRFEVNFRRTTP